MTVQAAGGVLWRRDGTGEVEIALVHRPRYDDWSLPKGKLDPGEHPLAGALREIEQETGFAAVPGRPLGSLEYVAFGAPKRVRYWSCRATTGRFRASREVDRLTWVGLADAEARIEPERDGPVLRRFAAGPRDTRALVVVRHASAGDRGAWDGEDRDRPLDATGEAQAAALTALLRAYAVEVAVSVDVRRCLDTLAPFARATGIAVSVEPGLTAGAPGAPDAGVEVLLRLSCGPAAVACTQRELAADLVAGACVRLGAPVRAEDVGEPDKAGLVVLHLTDDPEPALVDWERLPPPC
jgi:8-oxo-dGTP diphosphatase